MSLEWSVDFEGGDEGARHVARFEDRKGEERELVITPEVLDGKTWFGLLESDPEVLDQGDQDVYFSEVDAAREYAEKLRQVFLGLCPMSEGSVFHGCEPCA